MPHTKPKSQEKLSSWRPRSLKARQFLAVSLGLIAFLAMAGYALDIAFLDVAGQVQRERLKSYAYNYAGSVEFFRNGDIYVPEVPPDPRFDRPGSGLYAMAVLPSGSWESMSTRGQQMPPIDMLPAGQELFKGPLPIINSDDTDGAVFAYGIGLMWSPNDNVDAEFQYTIYVLEDVQILTNQTEVFRRALWWNLGISGIVLLILQSLILRWSLFSPLRNVEEELKRVQRGESNRMSDRHPRELTPLTESINALIDSERENLERQRNTMADLAHSLKTPLAVLKARLDDPDTTQDELREDFNMQLQRMNDLVSYQLGRAASAGHKLFSAPIEIETYAEQIVQGLEKIYSQKGVICEFEIKPNAKFYGEAGDLQELLGNLLENAFKWAKSRVLLTVQDDGIPPPNRRAGLRIAVEDDGPGIPEDRISYILQRGVRGDERVHGHGIGLSIIQDLVKSYRGTLHVGQSEELGGAQFEVKLPPSF